MLRFLPLIFLSGLLLASCGHTEKAVKAKELAYTTAPSDLADVNFKIIYHKEDRKRDYAADTGAVADTVGEEEDADSGKVYLVFSHTHCRQFYLSHRRINNILHVKYDTDGYDNTDVIFTKQQVYMVHSYTDKKSKSTFSDVFIIPKVKTGFEYLKLFANLEDADQPERDIFYAAILYCQAHGVKM